MELKHLEQFEEKIDLSRNKSRVAVAAANDSQLIKACGLAIQKNYIHPIFIGNRDKILASCAKIQLDESQFSVKHSNSEEESCELAVNMAKNDQADIVMKGLVSSKIFLKAILNKKTGMAPKGILSHLAIFQSPYYHKLIGVTDAALNILPGIEEKTVLIQNAVGLFRLFGINKPKVALLAPIEKENSKIQSTVDARILKGHFEKYPYAYVEGPLALDNAISKDAARTKGIENPVAGDADILIVPELNSGNILYKSLNFLGGAKSAAVVLGASSPIVLTSRADDTQTKYLSILLACMIAQNTKIQ